ncbi:hypothetical protein BKA56DRAFT_734516 [Ilyonectria sp. MPI-CAGE-AT-0026]|nr:hypothetical protein BKA56DRAFT_734516 [Ilyonectria sp. MPI-CAGE-AT-0026]
MGRDPLFDTRDGGSQYKQHKLDNFDDSISEPQALGGNSIGSSWREVHILHPGYVAPDEEEEAGDILISLPAFDDGVGHIFNSTPSEQLPKLWHNRELHTLPSVVSVECLFARFAWTIFSPAVFRQFLYSTLTTRRLLTWDSDLRKHVIENADPERCRRIFAAARSRSESPKKRSRGESGAREDHDDDDGEAVNGEHDPDEEFSSDIDSGYHADPWSLVERLSGTTDVDAQDEPERGRARKRKPDETDHDSPGLEATAGDFHRPKRANLDSS